MTFIVLIVPSVSQKALSKSSGPPAFFLQDPTDGLCLAGEIYKRCAIDTLWFVTGKPGSYKVQKRPIEEGDDSQCLSKAVCHLDDTSVKLTNCNHCGAQKWNIIGDTSTGYVLTEDGNKFCIKRDGIHALVNKCDKGYSALTLQFATKDDITAMGSDGARFITAASDNDLESIKNFLHNKVDINSRDWDNTTALIAASGKGNLDTVKYLISNGADINLSDKDNVTALTEAAMGGHTTIVDYLLNVGADFEVTAASGVTPLWLAAGEGHYDIVKLLLSKGANPNPTRMDGITALMVACAGGHSNVVKALLDGGADVNSKDKEGLTALISASENGSVPIVNLLVEYKAEINTLSDTGFSPLIIASAHGHLDVVKILVESNAAIELDHPEEVTALMYASAGGYPDVVKYLIEKGANVNKRHKQGGSAILEAATSGNFTVFKTLLDAGADPFVVDDDGVTTLMSASSQGHIDIVKLLVEMKSDVNIIAKSGGTAIMFAAGSGHNETVKFLIESGADVNIVVQATPEYIEQVSKAIAEGKTDVEPHKDGVTALMVACEGGYLEIVKMLVNAGALVDIVDDEDMTPLLNAVKKSHFDIALYLIENGANPNDSYLDDKGKAHNLLMDSILTSNGNFSLALVNKGANLSYVDDDGVSPLTQAAYLGFKDVVDALIANGADANNANIEGITPFIAAASEGHIDILKSLIATGKIDVNSKDKDGTNALMAAAVRGHTDVINLIIENGVDVNSQNVDGHTALMFAYNGKNQIETLLDKYKDYISESTDNSTQLIKDALKTHIDVVNILLKNGADPLLKDLEGHIAIDFDYKAPSAEGTIVQDKEL
eukprot:gene17130-22644_t